MNSLASIRKCHRGETHRIPDMNHFCGNSRYGMYSCLLQRFRPSDSQTVLLGHKVYFRYRRGVLRNRDYDSYLTTRAQIRPRSRIFL